MNQPDIRQLAIPRSIADRSAAASGVPTQCPLLGERHAHKMLYASSERHVAWNSCDDFSTTEWIEYFLLGPKKVGEGLAITAIANPARSPIWMTQFAL